jgi:hypothetical protein
VFVTIIISRIDLLKKLLTIHKGDLIHHERRELSHSLMEGLNLGHRITLQHGTTLVSPSLNDLETSRRCV